MAIKTNQIKKSKVFLLEKRKRGQNREQYFFACENGYGASVVTDYVNSKLWELAVIKDNEICYDTHITNDVLTRLTTKDVTRVLEQIANL